jgi:hypothetical protein
MTRVIRIPGAHRAIVVELNRKGAKERKDRKRKDQF